LAPNSFFSNREIDDAYKVLYENYNRMMRDLSQFQEDMKKFQKDVLAQLNKYPTVEDLEKWRNTWEGME